MVDDSFVQSVGSVQFFLTLVFLSMGWIQVRSRSSTEAIITPEYMTISIKRVQVKPLISNTNIQLYCSSAVFVMVDILLLF